MAMATRKTKTPTRTRAKKAAVPKPGPKLDWMEMTLKRKRFSHENLHDIVVEILREVREIRRDIDRLLERG